MTVGRSTRIEPNCLKKIHLETGLLTFVALIALLAFLWYADNHFSNYSLRIMHLFIVIFIILAVSYNLINGITGQFSLEPNAFLAVEPIQAPYLRYPRRKKSGRSSLNR